MLRYNYLGPKAGYILYASSDIPQGEQIRGTYGPKSNHDLLGTYGFTDPDNPEKIQLKFSMTLVQGNDPLFTKKYSLLEPNSWLDFDANPNKEAELGWRLTHGWQQYTLSIQDNMMPLD